MESSAKQTHEATPLVWYNEPAKWLVDENRLILWAEGSTDFWRITHYNFIRDNGHFYYREQAGNFLATVKVIGAYRSLYDQAGLMIWIDNKQWIKTGIEFVHGVQQISAVVTHNYSDWSVVPMASAPDSLYMKLLRKADFVEISYSLDGQNYSMLRLAYFPSEIPVRIGLMAAAPDGEGFQVIFEDFTVVAM